MAKLVRVTNIAFASTAPSDTVEQFGAFELLSSPNYTSDPAVIQALSTWKDGWTTAINAGNKAPYVQDMNAAFLVFSYQLSYLFQMGIPEWDAATTYYGDSFVQDNLGNGQIFISLQNNNTGNMPPVSASNAFWRWMNPAEYVVGASVTVNTVPKVVNAAATFGPFGSAVLSDSAISDNGTDVIISLPLKFPDGTVQSTAAQSPFVSAPQVISSPPIAQTVAHGLGVQPNFYTGSIRCVNAELGYSVGDEVLMASNSATGARIVIYANATYVGIGFTSAFPIAILDLSNFLNESITLANWRFIFRAKV